MKSGKVSPSAKPITVINLQENSISKYLSIARAARDIGVHRGVVERFVRENRVWKNKFQFEYGN